MPGLNESKDILNTEPGGWKNCKIVGGQDTPKKV